MENSPNRADILNDPAQQEVLYQASKLWIESLAERNGLVGQLKVLPNDPDRYPYQRLDVNHLPAFRPSIEQVEKYGQAAIQERVLEEFNDSIKLIIGEDKFEQFSRELQIKAFEPKPSLVEGKVVNPPEAGSALKTVAARLNLRGQHTMLVGFHPNITALPVYAAVLIDAIKHNHSQQAGAPFDLFGLTGQIKMPINKSLAFAEYHGQPATELVNRFSNVDLIVPATASSRLFGIDNDLRKAVNEDCDQASRAHIDYLDSIGKSALLITDPTGSTAEHLRDNAGNLNGLRFRRLSPGALKPFEQFNYVWPVTMWWDKNSRDAKWHIDSPKGVPNASHANQLIYELAAETGKLAEVDVYFGKSQEALGQAALETSLR